MLNVMPKICDRDVNNIDNISDFLKYSDGVEIQLMSDDLREGFKNSIAILGDFPNIKYVVFHMPFYMVNLCYVHSNKRIENTYLSFVVDCIKYSLTKDIKIDILSHIAMRYQEFMGIDGMLFLNMLDYLVRDTNVGFLLENSIINLNMDDDEEDVLTSIFKSYNSEKFKFCLDLCHWQSSEFILKKKIKLNDVLLKSLKNVHFSMTYDKDGYCNKALTHGRVHLSPLACVNDIEYLKSMGVDLKKINLVTEISESDYKKRPDMKMELNYLNNIKLV